LLRTEFRAPASQRARMTPPSNPPTTKSFIDVRLPALTRFKICTTDAKPVSAWRASLTIAVAGFGRVIFYLSA
jgi:hypothetical protein